MCGVSQIVVVVKKQELKSKTLQLVILHHNCILIDAIYRPGAGSVIIVMDEHFAALPSVSLDATSLNFEGSPDIDIGEKRRHGSGSTKLPSRNVWC